MDGEGIVPSRSSGRMNMLLSNNELDTVVGGMMNDGRGQLDPKPPGHLPGRGENGAPCDDPKGPSNLLAGGMIMTAAIIALSPLGF
jgi:hypothetical protein